MQAFSPAAIGINVSDLKLDKLSKSSGGFTGSSTHNREYSSQELRICLASSLVHGQFVSTIIGISSPKISLAAFTSEVKTSCNLIYLYPKFFA